MTVRPPGWGPIAFRRVGDEGTGPSPAPGPVDDPDVANWPIGATRFYAVDTAAGDDTSSGSSDISQAAAFTRAKKTLAGLIAVLPRFANGQNVQIAIKGGSYVPETLRLEGLEGYDQIHLVASSDGTDSAGDRILSGFVTAAAGPGAGGRWTCAAGGTVSAFTVGAGVLPAEATGVLRRVRFTGNVTAGLANVCCAIYAKAGGQITTCDNLPVAPAAGDTFFIEEPGTVFSAVVLEDIAASTLAVRGIRSASTWLTRNVQAARNIYTGCEADIATFDNQDVLSLSGIYTGIDAAPSRVGVGCRAVTSLLVRNVLDVQGMDRSGSIGSVGFVNIPSGTVGSGTVALGQTQLFGVGRASGGGSGTGGFQFTAAAGFRGARFEESGLGAIVAIGTRITLDGCNPCFLVPGIALKLIGSGSTARIKGGTWNGSVDLRLADACEIYFDAGVPPTFTAAPNVITAPFGGEANVSLADVQAMTSLTDPGNNLLWSFDGTTPAQRPQAEACIPFLNDTGAAATAPGNALYISGRAGDGKPKCKLSLAGVDASARLDGVACTTTANGATGLMVRANSGSPFMLFDAATVAAGDKVYLSTTAGKVTPTSPAVVTALVGRSLDGDGVTNPGNSHVVLGLVGLGPTWRLVASGANTNLPNTAVDLGSAVQLAILTLRAGEGPAIIARPAGDDSGLSWGYQFSSEGAGASFFFARDGETGDLKALATNNSGAAFHFDWWVYGVAP